MIWILFFLVSFASFAGIIITPALPDIVRDLNISNSAAQYLLSTYLFGYAIGIPLYGPIANRFGRKKALFVGLILSFCGTVLCLTSHFSLLMAGRALQALGAGGLFKLVFTIVADRYSEQKAYKVLAMIMLAFGIVPGIANVLGGYLTQLFTWHSCFIFLLIYILFLTLLSCFLPETALALDPDAFQWKRIKNHFVCQFKNKTLVLNGILMGLGTSLSYVFAAQAPFIAKSDFGLSPDIYGLFNMIPAVGLAVGLLIARQLTHRIAPQTIVFLGIIVLSLGSIAIGYAPASIWVETSLFFIFFGCIQFGNGCVVTVSPAQALSRVTDKSYGAAVLQFSNIGLSTIMTWIAGRMIPKTIFWLSMTFCSFALGMLILWFLVKKTALKTVK